MKKILVLFFLAFSMIARAQDDSCATTVSLLTCTPGEELYSTFGHSAFRVKDTSRGMDIIFNYGTFDFEDPQFYKKFTLGKLLYFVSVDSLANFLYEYEYFNRGVTEQVLNLDCAETKMLVAALFENAKEENKYYLYDFVLDNCTTRLRDMLELVTGEEIDAKDIRPRPGTTFRHLIHEYLHKGGQHWSRLGIDILLGSPLDRKISNREAMFLPDYLMTALDSARTDGRQLVTEKRTLLAAREIRIPGFTFTPFVAFLVLFLIIGALSFFAPAAFTRAFDIFFFSLAGLLGFLLLFMWFFTNHPMCDDNYNLLWALPTHLPMAVMLLYRRHWIRAYFSFIFFFSIMLAASWYFLPQQMNHALLPVLGIIMVRSYFISKPRMPWIKN